MYYCYEDYLSQDKVIDFERMRIIHENITKEIASVSNDDAVELYDELLEKAIEYAALRARWNNMTMEEKAEADSGRTMKHNSLIVKFNQLARFLRMQGKPATWRDELGYEDEDKMNRKKIGDMGCYLAFVHAINAR